MILSNKNLIVILGMPRSGTSAITKSLSVFNVSFGDNLLEKNEIVNPTGYWEDNDILNLNVEILNHLNMSWSSLKPVELSAFDEMSLKIFYEKALKILIEKTNDVEIFALKEPRITKLFCFWDYVIKNSGINCKYVIALRHPNDILDSFVRLKGKMVNEIECRRTYVYNLFLSYMLSIRDVFNYHNEFHIISYNSLLNDSQSVIRSMGRKFDIEINEEELENYCTSFLTKKLDHSSKNILNVNDSLLDEYYRLLLKIEVNELEFKDEGYFHLNKLSIEFDKRIEFLTFIDDINVMFYENGEKLSSINQALSNQNHAISMKNKEVALDNANLIYEVESLNEKIKALESNVDSLSLKNEFLMNEVTKKGL